MSISERLQARLVRMPLWALTLCCFLNAAGARAQAPQAEKPAENDLWAAGVASIESGRFAEARDLIGKILTNAPDKESYREIANWLDQRDRMQDTRLELQHAVRQRNIERAKQFLEKDKLAAALRLAHLAVESSSEPAEFMREPWVQAMHDKAVEVAAKYRADSNWADASELYYLLKNLFEGNAQYEKLMDECLSHSRLEAVYDPNGNEEDGWRSRLQGITEKMVEDALWRIQSSYVDEADFRRVVEGGLRRLLLLAESKAMKQQFPAMADEDKNTQYVTRIDRRIQVLSHDEAVSYAQATRYFNTALKINRQTVDLPPELVIHEFMEGALEELDKFTSMIWPADFADFEKHTQGHFPGVGIQIGLENNELTVISPLEDTPAFHAGIQAGDKITHIDGESTKGLSLNGAVRKITGPVDTSVMLTVNRPETARSFDVKLKRAVIQIKTVKGFLRAEGSQWDYMIDPEFGISYLRVTNFSDSTTSELKDALHQIKDMGAKALILDLRFNPGGLLRSAIEVSELFVPDNKLIVRTEGRDSEPFSRSSENQGHYMELPMIVLVNEQSASASEIVSGALKDHARALIVGERTFGKGSVQNLIPMGNTPAHLKLTTAYYYLPGGRCIHKVPGAEVWGVEPDIEVKLSPDEVGNVFCMRRDADVIRAAHANGAASPTAAAEPPSASPESAQAGVAYIREGGVVVTKEPTREVTIQGSVSYINEDGAVVQKATIEKTEAPSASPGSAQGSGAGAAGEPAAAAGGDHAEVTPAKPAPGAADGDATAGADDEVEENPIVLPNVDYQLETAKLVLRVQLLKDLGFTILPKGKQTAGEAVGPRT